MDYEELKIKDYKHWEVTLHHNQYYLGRIVIWAHREEDIDIIDMSKEEREEFFKIAKEVKKALLKLFKPDRINYTNLQNSSHHLHVHVIPRYKKSRFFEEVEFIDKRWGNNPSPYDKEFKVSNSILYKIRDAIKEIL
ncbi:MAG: hypothetical protein CMH64_04210 [Nanoarchaeota archaeon]|nr:hypothetical protein [Nanoarchaeota archaeon]|tara:strand:+ start:1794 stop:2204 length:411 start_codon:yes stop_codon:yes gene_type:complete